MASQSLILFSEKLSVAIIQLRSMSPRSVTMGQVLRKENSFNEDGRDLKGGEIESQLLFSQDLREVLEFIGATCRKTVFSRHLELGSLEFYSDQVLIESE